MQFFFNLLGKKIEIKNLRLVWRNFKNSFTYKINWRDYGKAEKLKTLKKNY